MAWHNLKDSVSWLLLALGITGPPAAFFGGLFLAFAFGYLASVWMPEHEKRELRLMLLTAALLSVLIAILHPHMLPNWPLQACMAGAGFFSRYLVALLLKISGRTVEKSSALTDTALERLTGHPVSPKDDHKHEPSGPNHL